MDHLTPGAADVVRIVSDTFVEVAREQGIALAPLAPATPLMELGLDSLCLAVIVVRLEARLGRDPFAASDGIAMPTTFADFVGLYA